jgi:predicted ATP-dependent serine protease
MNIVTNTTKCFTQVSKIKIPEVYYKRFKTGEQDLDEIYGKEGFVPGMTFTLAAPPGSGKTTILLQTLQRIQNTNKQTAYVSGEESVHQLAFACQRLNIENVSVANLTTIEDIFDIVKKSNIKMLIIDSFPSMRSRLNLHGKRLEEYLSNYICTKSKELECVVGIVLHTTKTGQYKGSTLLPHSVDCNIIVKLNDVDKSIREFTVTKNRFGSICDAAFRITSTGFVFDKVQAPKLELPTDVIKQPKLSKINEYRESILNFVKQQKYITLQQASQILNCSLKAQSALRDLVLKGNLTKSGRGQYAIWL